LNILKRIISIMSVKESKDILVGNPGAQYLVYKDEINAAIKKVLESGWYILGNAVKQFEESFAQFVGVKYCIGVANGTDAVALALRAGGVKPGDEVITVSHSAVATVAAIEQIGAVPVFCDIEPVTRGLDPERLQDLISKKTKAVVPVHIYGQPTQIEKIIKIAKEFNLLVVEDCAQAHGAKVNGKTVGSFGDLAAFSFYPTKNLGAIGDGGAVVANSQEFAKNVDMLRQYGWKTRYISEIAGVNSRLDELQAAVLSVKLKYLELDNQRRRDIASIYTEALKGSTIQAPPLVDGTTHAMHLYVVETSKRDELREFLQSKGIQAALHYPQAIHQQVAYQGRVRGGDKLQCTDALYKRILTLPLYPELTEEEVDRVTNALVKYLKG
jgi:dTDP-4-amino-4,6-dideoxygalactose transaminase